MRLLSLNTFGGVYFDSLIKYIEENKDYDIFCFQEMFDTTSDIKVSNKTRTNLLYEIKKILPFHKCFFAPSFEGHDNTQYVNFDLRSGLAIFIKLETISVKEVFIKHQRFNPIKEDMSDLPVNLFCVTFKKDSNQFNIITFHGDWITKDKLDTPARLEQSAKLIEFMKTISGEIILCGDFNLMPQTESIKRIENFGLRNLIKDFNIEDTRGEGNIVNGKKGRQKFADYTFVSQGVDVKSFKVPPVFISDHLPMILEFN